MNSIVRDLPRIGIIVLAVAACLLQLVVALSQKQSAAEKSAVALETVLQSPILEPVPHNQAAESAGPYHIVELPAELTGTEVVISAVEPAHNVNELTCSERAGCVTSGTKEKIINSEPALPPFIPAGTVPWITIAINDLAQRRSVPLNQIEILSFANMTWPDSSLGCPQPDWLNRQIPVEGYIIQLTTGGQIYSYHGGTDGEPFLCEPVRTAEVQATSAPTVDT